MLAGRILTVLRASVCGSNGGVDDEGGLVAKFASTDTDDYPRLMLNMMWYSVFRVAWVRRLVSGLVGLPFKPQSRSRLMCDAAGSAIRSHSLFAVGRLVDVAFRVSRGVVCRGLRWCLVPCGVVGCVCWVVCGLGWLGCRVRADVARRAWCQRLLVIVVRQQL